MSTVNLKYSERISELEKELKETRDENDQMRQDISDYKMQMQTQRDSIVSRRGEDAEFKEKLAKKNRELAETMEELQNVSDANDLLQKRCDDLQKNLEDAILQMDRTREDYLKLKSVLQQSDAVTDALREENEVLKNQVQDLTEQVQSKGEADDAIMVAVNQKVDEWQEIMQEKDFQISHLQEQLFRMKEQLIAASMDSDKATVSALSEVLKDKDKQIADLTEKIDQYTLEMEKNAAIISDLNSELHKADSAQGSWLQNKLKDLQNENRNCKENLKQLEDDTKKCSKCLLQCEELWNCEKHEQLEGMKAEEDCRSKDKQLSELLERMRQYEGGEYGLSEAVAEIKSCKNQIKIRERMVEEILNTRLMVKKSMKSYKNDQVLTPILDARQLGLKLIANVTYGYTGASYSGRMPCIEVGDSIVIKARESLERAVELVRNTPRWGAHVVYGDIDSMFIHFPGRTKDEAFVLGQEIADAVTAMFPSPMKLRFEKSGYDICTTLHYMVKIVGRLTSLNRALQI